MSPHRKDGSPFYYLRPTVRLPGRGSVRLPERCSYTESKRVAGAMEQMLRDLPREGYLDLIERYEAGELDVRDLYTAKRNGRLDELRASFTDPPLLPLLEAFEPADERAGHGMRRLPELIERVRAARGETGELRLSWLLVPSNILAVLLERRDGDGVKQNSVRRAEYRAISEFLMHVRPDEKVGIMAAVKFSQEDDERAVWLPPEDVRTLLRETCEPLLRCAVTIVLGTGLDRSPLLRMIPRDFRDARPPRLRVRDTKTRARRRELELGPAVAGAIRQAIMLSGAGPRDRIFDWTEHQLRHRFDTAVDRAGLDELLMDDGTTTRLRLKDLRGVFATYFLLGGGSPKDLQAILGHENIETTLRYVKRLPVKRGQDMTAAEQKAGLRLLLEETG